MTETEATDCLLINSFQIIIFNYNIKYKLHCIVAV